MHFRHLEILTVNAAHLAKTAALLILGENSGHGSVLERGELHLQILLAGSGLEQIQQLALAGLVLLLLVLGKLPGEGIAVEKQVIGGS